MAAPVLTPEARREAMRDLCNHLPNLAPEERSEERGRKLDVLAAGPNEISGYSFDRDKRPVAVFFRLPPTPDMPQSIGVLLETIAQRRELLDTLSIQDRAELHAMMPREDRQTLMR